MSERSLVPDSQGELPCSRGHLVTLHRAFPFEADHMREAFAAAAAAPHGGHVVFEERTVVCGGDHNILDCFDRRGLPGLPPVTKPS